MIRIRIAELVSDRGISLYKFANECGITYNQIYSIAKGKTKRIDFKTIEMFCEHLHCEPGDLFEYTDTKVHPHNKVSEIKSEDALF